MIKEALKLALEALELDSFYGTKKQEAITAIKEALAQPEHGWTPERIAGMATLKEAQDKKLAQHKQLTQDLDAPLTLNGVALYPQPPQRTWVGLTDDEINTVAYNNHPLDGIRTFARVIEAKLKEKNT